MSDAAILERGLGALGIGLSAQLRGKLLEFARLLLKWNRVYNLTAIRDPEQVVSHHLLDSLAVLPLLRGVGRLADVGSGGGLPGIPLAIARPDLQVISIEAVDKKASFQRQVRIELELANLQVHHGRIEDFDGDGVVDAVISRAFSDLAEFVRLAARLLAPQGRLLAMKGALPRAEIDALPAGVAVEAVIPLAVPELAAERHLIVLNPHGAA